MNFRTLALAAVGLIAFGTSAVSFAQTAPQGTPPPPPVPNLTASPSAPALPPTTPTPVPSLPETTPTPVPFSSPSVEPSAAPSPQGRGRRGKSGPEPSPGPSPTDTPEQPQFSTLDGVWEIALQPLNGGRTIYSHLYVTQAGNTLTGTWRRDSKTALPFSGTFDGRLFKLSVTVGATTEQLSGYEENYMDMVGLYTTADSKTPGVPFTAAHRKRERDRTIIR